VDFQNNCVNCKGPIKNVYRFMLNKRMFEIAYANLRSKPGNITHSINLTTLDGLVCSLCKSDYRVEMHHVRHLKDIDPNRSLTDKLMLIKKRKQIPLCHSCHLSLHHKK
jgi:hypothetical protein